MIYLFSWTKPEEPKDATKARDVFNEKPPTDELLAALDLGKAASTSLPDNVASFCCHHISSCVCCGKFPNFHTFSAIVETHPHQLHTRKNQLIRMVGLLMHRSLCFYQSLMKRPQPTESLLKNWWINGKQEVQ